MYKLCIIYRTIMALLLTAKAANHSCKNKFFSLFMMMMYRLGSLSRRYEFFREVLWIPPSEIGAYGRTYLRKLLEQ